jgi:hypothetical protein
MERTPEMTSFTKPPSGSWRVQVRRKGRYVRELVDLHIDDMCAVGKAPFAQRPIRWNC